jgi:hypothetical protein
VFEPREEREKACGLESNSSSERRGPQGKLLCSSTLVRTNLDNTKPVRFFQFYADLLDILLNRRSGVIFTCERTGQEGVQHTNTHTSRSAQSQQHGILQSRLQLSHALPRLCRRQYDSRECAPPELRKLEIHFDRPNLLSNLLAFSIHCRVNFCFYW